MKYLFSLIVTLFLIDNSSIAQEYVQLMEIQTSNFYDIQNSFNNYWDGKTYERGKGWKQFKRWEWFMEPRVYPSGKLPDPSFAYNEFVKFKNTYGVKKGTQNNKAANWTPLGPTNWNSIGWNPGIGRINAITVDPNNSNTIYVGTPAGGCWKTTNGGNNWSPLTDNLSSLGVSGIAIDPTNSNIVYIATGDGDGNDTYSIGVLKSIDGGTTWNSTGLNWSTTQARVMRKIIIDPTNSNILFVASSNGLYKTTDAGVSWTSVLTGSFRDVEFNPLNPNTLFSCTNTLFYKSTDGGNTFTNITNGIPSTGVGRLSVAVTVNDTSYIYLLASNSSNNSFLGLYRSTDSGNNFNLRTSTPNVFGYSTTGNDNGGQSWYDMALAVSPTNKNEVYTGGVNVWKSIDGGSSLTALTQWDWPTAPYEYVHADIHTLDFYGNTLFCGSDGGIFKSANAGNTFTDLTSGIQHSQFYRLSSSVTDPTIIMGGTQDNGCFMRKNGTWTHVTGGDGMECIVDYSNANIVYSSSQRGAIYKSIDGGGTFNGITGSISSQGAWVTPYTLDPVNPNTIYLGYEDIWKSTDGGTTWNTISAFSTTTDLQSLVVAPSNNNYIYAATYSDIYRTTNGGGNWTNITNGLPSNAITYISVHNTNPDILWVSLSGFTNGQKVYKSIDGGASWINVSVNLPNIPINCIVYENGTNNGTYVGTDMGIYYKNDNLSLWQAYTTNLPNVIVNELEIHYGINKIRAATYGRGIWESDLFTPAPPIAQFFSPDTNICPGICANFTNTTVNLGSQWTWYFPGGTPSTSTSLNPTVCYPTFGNYDVSLIVYNSLGNDSIYVANYIKVQAPTIGNPLPLVEGFENSSNIPVGWTIVNNDQGVEWEHNSFVGGFGLSSSSYSFNNYSVNARGERDYLVTPSLDFTNLNNVELTFDVAHAQFAASYSDTLAIYYSTDCGVTKTLLWEKDAQTLATSPIYSGFFIPTSSQWRNDTVNLNALIGLNAANIYFENKSDFGNLIYIDNININDITTVGIEEKSTTNVNIYPNPFENTINIKSNDELINRIQIYDVLGKLIIDKIFNQVNNTIINLSTIKSGFYILKLETNQQVVTKNIIKK